MEERTAEEVAAIFAAAGDSVTVINTDKTDDETVEDYKATIQRNVDQRAPILDLPEVTAESIAVKSSLVQIDVVPSTFL